MRFQSIIVALVVVLTISVLATSSTAQQDDGKKAATITCIVSGETVLKAEAVGPHRYNNTDYYFCCNGCLEKFKKDPETYLNKTTDLVCGMTIDKRTAIKASFEGKDYYFCSEGCKNAFEKDSRTYSQKAMKTAHQHDENCQGEGCSDGKKEGAGCCGSKTKSDKKVEKK